MEPAADDGVIVTTKKASKKAAKKKAPAKRKAPAKAKKAPAKKKGPAKKAPAKKAKKKAPAKKKGPVKKKAPAAKGKVKLLSGGNPQIPKGEGDAPVQAYIEAMPGWKRAIGRRIDELIVETVPDVHKAVKWNSPFWGHEGEGWFLSIHCFDRYVKVTWFRGTSLDPVPPGTSTHNEVRYLDIYEEGFDENQFVDWVKQASALPGEQL